VEILLAGQADAELKRDVNVYPKNGSLKCVDELHGAYDPLQYVLLFPYGQFGWNKRQHIIGTHKNITIDTDADEAMVETTTPMLIYSFQLQERANSYIHYFGKLYHQYIVDQYAKIECTRLTFIRFNQEKIRAELYGGLMDALNERNCVRGNSVESRIILLSTF
jgi:hypothetical protein